MIKRSHKTDLSSRPPWKTETAGTTTETTNTEEMQEYLEWKAECKNLTEMPKEALWLFYQNYSLNRQLEAQNISIQFKSDLWLEFEGFLESLITPKEHLPEVLQ